MEAGRISDEAVWRMRSLLVYYIYYNQMKGVEPVNCFIWSYESLSYAYIPRGIRLNAVKFIHTVYINTAQIIRFKSFIGKVVQIVRAVQTVL